MNTREFYYYIQHESIDYSKILAGNKSYPILKNLYIYPRYQARDRSDHNRMN